MKEDVHVLRRSRRRLPCPRCLRERYRDGLGSRQLRDLGDPRAGRARRLKVVYSVHRCEECQLYFSADMADLAAPRGRYTRRVMDLALRLVLMDRLSYKAASRELRRRRRVRVPWPTIRNWAATAGGKRPAPVPE